MVWTDDRDVLVPHPRKRVRVSATPIVVGEFVPREESREAVYAGKWVPVATVPGAFRRELLRDAVHDARVRKHNREG